MPRNVNLIDLVTRCQQRCDRENDPSISPTEWKTLISSSYGELYALIVDSGMRYFETSSSITATGAASYPLPTDHLETIGLDRVLNTGGDTRELTEAMIQERNRWSGQTGDAVAYAIIAQTIVLYPKPSSGTYAFVYIAQPPDLSAAADSTPVDVMTVNGEEFLIYATAIKAHAKGETDAQLAVAEREAARIRVKEDAIDRALINPRRRMVREPLGYDGAGHLPGDWWWDR